MKKYEFTGEEIKVGERTLRRIRALVDVPPHGVKAGDLGGFIEDEHNLSHEGSCWVYPEAKVYGNSRVYENAKVCGYSRVYGDARVFGNATVETARVYGDAWVYGTALVNDYDQVFGCTRVCGNTEVQGFLPLSTWDSFKCLVGVVFWGGLSVILIASMISLIFQVILLSVRS